MGSSEKRKEKRKKGKMTKGKWEKEKECEARDKRRKKEYEECGKGIDGIDRQLASFLQEINIIRVTSLIFFPL